MSCSAGLFLVPYTGAAIPRPPSALTTAPVPTAPVPTTPVPTAPVSTPVSNVPISSLLSTTEVISRLGDHGCPNITNRLDLHSCSARPISSGGFGEVYRGKLLDGSQVAIKTMRIHIGSTEPQKPLKNAARELHTWSKCRHSNVIELLGIVEFRDQIGMVSYWMEHGSLPAYLERRPDVDRCLLSTEICEGLSYLHAANIVHGDLKGANILISGGGKPMLTDFGNAILQESTLQFTATTQKYNLSPRWAAPELLEGSGECSFAADVYALGMTILETITGQVPFIDREDHVLWRVIGMEKKHPSRPENLISSRSKDGNTLWTLLMSCWVYEPKSRPNCDQVRDMMKTITHAGLATTEAADREE